MELSEVKFDCRHFRGTIPCKPNKLRGKICECDEYTPISKRILIIKLGAMGDVIRTTPLVVRYRQLFPDCHISWITLTPQILPPDEIDAIYKFDHLSVYSLLHEDFDIAINLDKEIEACGLLRDVRAKEKIGFIEKNGHVDIANPEAKHKLITGLFDQISIQNKKSYLEEIFEICKMKFNYEPYLINQNRDLVAKWESLREKSGGKPIVGLNTGCGQRWLTRLWPQEYWIALITRLQNEGMFPMVLGGPDEEPQNLIYAQRTGCYYPGTYSLPEFMAITANCDLVVTAVSMMMHIAMGLQKPLVLFNNIFNKHEFEMYGRGEILEPHTGCEDFYGTRCTRERHCMLDLPVDDVFNAIQRHLPVIK
ncbi:MAG: glycosyltransferase family 9 protein [Bacteroidia bacterium]